MSTKLFKLTGLIAALSILAIGLLAFAQPGTAFAAAREGSGPGGGSGYRWNNTSATTTRGGGYAAGPLSEAEINALNEAFMEEYGALNTYNLAIEKFGSVYPFNVIAQSEQQHVNNLIRLANRYNVPVPANPGLSTPPAMTSLEQACAVGVAAEKADAALYDELLADVTHRDITNVFTNLQRASLDNHLPAFQACE